MKNNPSFWASRKVLLTGAGGFLGQHLLSELLELPCTVKTISGKEDLDLRDPFETAAVFKQYKPDVVFHLAALVGGIGANRSRPADFFIDNALMGASILNACRENRPERLVMVGTTCSYPKHCPTPFRENDLWAGFPEETNAPYGVAKRALMVGADALSRQYGVSVRNIIPANMYGPGDNFDPQKSHVIPALIRKFSEARGVVKLWGNGTATRDFLYVKDCARALVRAAEVNNIPKPINLGTGVEVSIKLLAKIISTITDFRGKIVWETAKPGGQPRRVLDIRSAAKWLGWRASMSLPEGLRETIEWYQANVAECKQQRGA